MHTPRLTWERELLRSHYSYYHVAYNTLHTTCIAYIHKHPFDSFQNAHKRTVCHKHTTKKNQSQIKRDQLDPPVVIWVLKNNVASQQELDVGRPVSLVKHQVRVVWGFHTPAQRSRLHSLTPPMLHKPTELHIPVSISFFSLSLLSVWGIFKLCIQEPPPNLSCGKVFFLDIFRIGFKVLL